MCHGKFRVFALPWRCCKPSAPERALALLQLRSSKFDALIHSPLARAAETAKIVWGPREGPVTVVPSLREIDLYTFEVRRSGLCKWRFTRL